MAPELRYHISTRAADGDCILTLEGYSSPDQVLVLDVIAGKATCALCPWCGKPARKLYVAPNQSQFRCWRCWDLVYRGRTKPAARWLAYERALANPVLDLVAELPWRVRHRPWRSYVEAPPSELAAELAGELPLGPEELRLWCLRLRQVGLSYRQIAGLTESSKSTVSRLCLAGRAGINLRRLIDEREAIVLAARPRSVRGQRRRDTHGDLPRRRLAAHPGWPVWGVAGDDDLASPYLADTSSAMRSAASSCSAGMACE